MLEELTRAIHAAAKAADSDVRETDQPSEIWLKRFETYLLDAMEQFDE